MRFALLTSSVRQRVRLVFTAIAVAAFCVAFASEARANCSGFATRILRGAAWHPGAESGRGNHLALVRAVPTEAIDDERAPITGLWKTDFIQDGQVVDQAFETFTSDGNELMVDTTPPSLDNVCNGIWERVGGTYKIKHPSWLFDATGAVTGTAVFRTELTLNRNATRFQGKTTIDIFDTAGNLVAEFTGDVRGTRITVD